MSTIGIVFTDPAFVQDNVGVVGAKASIEPTSGRVKVEIVGVVEFPPPQTASSIMEAISGMEATVLEHTRGATLHIGADISGNGAAMAMPILGRYYRSAQVRFVRWHGGDAHARPTAYEPLGTISGKVVGAPVWGLSKALAFGELDELANAGRLTFNANVAQEALDRLADAAVGTQIKQTASGRIVPSTDQSTPDDVLSALVGSVAIAQHTIDWNAIHRALGPRRRDVAKFTSSAWT